MPATVQSFCEQCLRNTTHHGSCSQHPHASQLSMDDPEDCEHYRLLRRLQRSHWVSLLLVVGYLVSLLIVSGFICVGGNISVVGSLIVTNLLFIALFLVVGVVLAPLWVCGVLGRDLLMDVRRKLWRDDSASDPVVLIPELEDSAK